MEAEHIPSPERVLAYLPADIATLAENSGGDSCSTSPTPNLSHGDASTQTHCIESPSPVQLQHQAQEPMHDRSKAQVRTNIELNLSISTNTSLEKYATQVNDAHAPKVVALEGHGDGQQDQRNSQGEKRNSKGGKRNSQGGKRKQPSSHPHEPRAKRRPCESEIRADPESENTSSTEQQLLRSRSNYEMIRSGATSVYGIAFPAPLLASVDYKRSRHQQDEQGRRDRMKVALQSLADLLPHIPKNANKAHVVEMASKHIRELHMQLYAMLDVRESVAFLKRTD